LTELFSISFKKADDERFVILGELPIEAQVCEECLPEQACVQDPVAVLRREHIDSVNAKLQSLAAPLLELLMLGERDEGLLCAFAFCLGIEAAFFRFLAASAWAKGIAGKSRHGESFLSREVDRFIVPKRLRPQ
jgi:hypothetical protein